MFQELKAVLTHPEFQKAVDEVSSLPVEQRGQTASTQLTLDALTARGVPIPSSISISDALGSGLTDFSLAGGLAPPSQTCWNIPFTDKWVCVNRPSR